MEFKDVEAAREEYKNKLESVRKARNKTLFIVYGIVFGIEAIILLFNLKSVTGYMDPFGIFFIFAVVLAESILIFAVVFLFTNKNTSKEATNYKKAFKAYFIEKQQAAVFQNLEYSHDQGLDKIILESTGLINTGDIYRSNDFTKGKYKDVNFAQADVHILNEYKEKDQNGNIHKRTVTIFKGRYMIFEFPKKFEFKMVISFNGYERPYINPKTKRSLSRIETESPEFNKRFLVYAEDGFEAFYILNPVFIESLEKLGRKYNNAISFFFSDNKLYIGINNGNDSFEPPDPYFPINEQKEKNKVIEEIKSVTEIVDNLKLNQK